MPDSPLTPDDPTLIALIVQRDPRGIEGLYRRYSGIAFAIAYRLLGERTAAEDVVQDVFFNLWRRAETFDARRGTVRAWLVSTVHHRAVDALRHRRATSQADYPIEEAWPLESDADTWGEVAGVLERERVTAAMGQLPANQREVMVLAYFDGLSQTEVAARLGIPLGTVKGRTRLALKKLRVSLLPEAVRDDGEDG